MTSDYLKRIERDMATGVLHLLILAHIRRGGPLHGYALIKELSDSTGGTLQTKPGTIYPILNQMEDAGLIRGQWAEAESGPVRRVYELTRDGGRVLALAATKWTDVQAGVQDALRPAREGKS